MKKRKFWRRVAAVSLVVTMAIPSGVLLSSYRADAAVGENLVVNGGFDTTGDWVDQTGTVIAAQEIVDEETTKVVVADDMETSGNWFGSSMAAPGEGRNGSQAITSSSMSGGSYFNYNSNGSTIFEAGKTYTISYYAKAAEGISWNNVLIASGDGSDQFWDYAAESEPAEDGWVKYSYTYTASAAAATYEWVQIGMQITGGSGTLYIDDLEVSCKEKSYVTSTETVVTDDMETSGNWFGSSMAAPGEGRNGSQAITSSSMSGGSYFNYNSNGSTIFEAGKTYTISYYAKAAEGISWNNVLIASGDGSDQFWDYAAESEPAEDGWVKYSYTYTASAAAATYEWVQIGMQITGGVGTLYLDDLSVCCNTSTAAKTCSEGIGNCNGEESGNVLMMKENGKAAQTIPVKAGKTYSYSYRMKTKDMGSDFAFHMTVGSERFVPTLAGNDWQTVTGQFTASVMGAELSFNKSGTGIVLIDDVEIKQETASENDVVLRFAVVSDTHIRVGDGTMETTRKQRLAKVFQTAYAYAGAQDYNKLDAVVVVGDMVDSGTAEEYQLFNQIVNDNIQAGTQLITLAGNHEFWAENDASNYKTFIDKDTNKSLDTVTTVNGYSFIALSQRDHDVYTGEQAEWLEEKLREADGDGNQKPIFTFQHFGVKDTVYGTTGHTFSPADALHEKYSGHAHVINFNGHTHAPINTPTIISQKNGYTQIATGTTYDMYMEKDASYGEQPPNSNNIAQYYIVEVYADNTVQMMPYNLLANEENGNFFKTPATEDGDAQLIYAVNVNDPENWKYTDAKRETAAPYFAEGAQMSFSALTYKGATISFPQAKDADSGVYLYEITCSPVERDGEIKTYTIFSEYYFEPMPATLSYAMTGLDADTLYTVSVTPIDFYGNRGAAITDQLRTQSSDEKLTLTFAGYHSTDKWIQLRVNNQHLLTGEYYSLPVTADGTEGRVAVSNSGTGTLTIWNSFVTAIDDLSIEKSLLIKSGARMEQVTSAGWTAIDGGDQETVSKNVYLEMTEEGVLADKTDFYQLLEATERAMDEYDEATVTAGDAPEIRNMLADVENIAVATRYLDSRLETVRTKGNHLLQKIADVEDKLASAGGKITGHEATLRDYVSQEIDETNITSEYKEELASMLADAETMLADEIVKAEYEARLNALKRKATSLLAKVQEAEAAVNTVNINTAAGITVSAVTIADKTIVTAAKADLEAANAAYSANYTSAEKNAMVAEINRIDTLLRRIEKLEEEEVVIAGLETSLSAYTTSTVKKADQNAIEEILEQTEALLSNTSTTVNNRSRLQEIKTTAERLLAAIANTGNGNTSGSENTSENGTVSTDENTWNGKNSNTSVQTGDNGVTVWLILTIFSFMVFVVASVKSKEECQ